MNCIIVDDEPLARGEMAALLSEVPDLDVLAQFSNAKTALKFLEEHAADLVFLDIEMPMINGLDLAGQLPDNTLVIFTTAYSNHALKSYELDAIDYLLKPIESGRLHKAINKARLYKKMLIEDIGKNSIEDNTTDFLLIKSERKFHRISYSDIRYIEGLKDYVVIHLQGEKLITAMNLKTIHAKIPGKKFIRVSKSYVINLDFVDSFDHHTIYLADIEIPLGEVFRKDFFVRYTGVSL